MFGFNVARRPASALSLPRTKQNYVRRAADLISTGLMLPTYLSALL